MAKNIISESDVVTIPAPAAIVSGQIVVLGHLLGVAIADAAIGELVALHREVVVEVPKAAGLALTLGQQVNFNLTTQEVAATGTNIGFAVLPAVASARLARVLLAYDPDPGPGP